MEVALGLIVNLYLNSKANIQYKYCIIDKKMEKIVYITSKGRLLYAIFYYIIRNNHSNISINSNTYTINNKNKNTKLKSRKYKI